MRAKRGQDLRARSPRAAPCLPGIGGTVTTRCTWSFINIQFFYLNVLPFADYPDTFFDVLRYGSLPEFRKRYLGHHIIRLSIYLLFECKSIAYQSSVV